MLRNNWVAEERRRILDMASEKAKWLMKNGFNWQEPYDYFQSVSYDEMLYKFWKPVGSFYDENRVKVPR